MATATTERMVSAPLDSYSDLLTDICDFAKFSGYERKELLGSLSKGSFSWQNMLQSLTRKQLKNYLILKTGVDKTFTSYSKCRLIDRLVKILKVNNAISVKNVGVAPNSPIGQCKLNVTRRLRKSKHPVRLSISSTMSPSSKDLVVTCQNVACRAKMSPKDPFCKRCSCCLCHKFDDNKDPSLWIICEQDSAFGKGGCGQSCHIECALAQGVAGVLRVGHSDEIDGGYWCQACGNVGELLGCWKKQLVIAKDARRLDVLCHRLSLAHRLLQGTSKYNRIHVPVRIAAQALEEEIGPFSKGSSTLVRGIVSRLSVASHVQENIEKALKNLEDLYSELLERRVLKKPELPLQDAVSIHFSEVSSTSFTVMIQVADKLLEQQIAHHEVWHRKVSQQFKTEPTCLVLHSNSLECFISDLDVGTEFVVRVVTSLKDGMKIVNTASCLTKGLKERNGFPGTAVTAKTSTAPTLVDRAFYELDCVENTFKIRDIGRMVQKSSSATDELSTKVKFWDMHIENLDFTNSFMTSIAAAGQPAIYNTNKQKELEVFGADTFDLNTHIHKQKLSKGSGDMKFRPCLKMNRHKASLSVLLDHFPVHTGAQLNAGNISGDTPLFHITEDRMASKSSVANGIFSFVYVQERQQIEDDFLQLRCSLPSTGANASDSLNVREFNMDSLEHSRQNGDSTNLIIYPHANDTKLQSEKRKRLASIHPWSSDKLDDVRLQEFSPPQSFQEVDFQHCVTVVRWLEGQGQVGALFRRRFLSWLGVQATDQQKRVIDAYIKVMISDPESLAEQLIDTFEEVISMSKQKGCPV